MTLSDDAQLVRAWMWGVAPNTCTYGEAREAADRILEALIEPELACEINNDPDGFSMMECEPDEVEVLSEALNRACEWVESVEGAPTSSAQWREHFLMRARQQDD